MAEFPVGLGVAEAQARIVEIAAKYSLPAERAALDAACGRVLAADVVAPRDVPGFVNSAMDGFAVRGADMRADGPTELRLIGQIFAGGSAAPELAAGTCVRITTGAPLPRGADTVVMKENTRAAGGVVHVEPGTPRGANVRAAGEDYRAGDQALAA